MSARSRRFAFTLATAAILCAAGTAKAATPFAGGGFDYYDGPGGQITRSALALGGVTGGAGTAALTLMRYDDSLVGVGLGYIGLMAIPLGPSTSLRVWGTRLVGDGSFRAWRLKAGPQFAPVPGSSLGLYYQHYTDNADQRTDGASAELEVPVAGALTGRATAGMARVPGGLNAGLGSVGLGWRPLPSLELSGEVGVARNGAFLTSSPGPSHGMHLPIIGGGPTPEATTTAVTSTERLYQLGLRVVLP